MFKCNRLNEIFDSILFGYTIGIRNDEFPHSHKKYKQYIKNE